MKYPEANRSEAHQITLIFAGSNHLGRRTLAGEIIDKANQVAVTCNCHTKMLQTRLIAFAPDIATAWRYYNNPKFHRGEFEIVEEMVQRYGVAE